MSKNKTHGKANSQPSADEQISTQDQNFSDGHDNVSGQGAPDRPHTPDIDTVTGKPSAEDKNSAKDASDAPVEHSAEEKAYILSSPRGVKREVADGAFDPRTAAPKKDLNIEDNLELHSMTRSERRMARKMKYKKDTEGMSAKEKFSHFLYCYKWRIIVSLLIIIAATYTTVSIYSNTRPVALAYGVVNSPNPFKLDSSVVDDYKNYYHMKKSDQVIMTSNINYDLDTYEEDYNTSDASYTSFPTLCYEDYYDVIISDKKGVEYCSYFSIIHPLTDCLTMDLQSELNNSMSDRILYTEDSEKQSEAFAIDISGTDFAKGLNLGYDNVYLCFPGTDERNIETARKLINYIFDLGLYDVSSESN